MDNVSLIPKTQKDKALPRFVSFQKPKLELNILSKIGLGLLAAGLLAWLSIYIWAKRIEAQVASATIDLEQLIGQRDMSLETRLKNLNAVLGIFKGVLDEHLYWTQFFKTLESKTLNEITFKNFSAGTDDNSVTVEGSARDYSSLAREVKALEDTSGINNVTASDVGLSEQGRINFKIKIVLDPDTLKRK